MRPGQAVRSAPLPLAQAPRDSGVVLSTRLTASLGLTAPIVSAPMALAAGGALAAAVSRAGGLGLIGGGYGDAAWVADQFAAADRAPVGIGFITWSLTPKVLNVALGHEPLAVMLSFGDPNTYAPRIHESGALLICQCQTLRHVRDALAAGADVVVAQGTEAGGHGMSRSTLPFVPEVADLIATESPGTLLLAAGGIADGRTLAAALALGADGALVGTRLWAAEEALVHPGHHAAILTSDGDGTVRTTAPDLARHLAWPAEFTARVRRNAFTDRWHGHEAELADADVSDAYRAAWPAGDAEHAGVFFGEAAGLIHAIEPAEAILRRMVDEARDVLSRF